MQVPPIRCLSKGNDLMSYDTYIHTYIHTYKHTFIHSCVSVRLAEKRKKGKIIRQEKRYRRDRTNREKLSPRGVVGLLLFVSRTVLQTLFLPVDRSDVSRWTGCLRQNGGKSFASTDQFRVEFSSGPVSRLSRLYLHFFLFWFLYLLSLSFFFHFCFSLLWL